MGELEQRLRQRRFGVRPWLALTCVAGTLFLLWLFRADIAYFFSSPEPITLGLEGAYKTERILTNRYVQLHGAPIGRAVYGLERNGPFVVVGLRMSPFLVRRRPLTGEQWRPGQKPPQPNPTPFGVRGRLLSRAEAGKYGEAFALLGASPELRPRDGQLFLVVEGARPLQDWTVPLGLCAAFLFVSMNGWMLLRSFGRQPSAV